MRHRIAVMFVLIVCDTAVENYKRSLELDPANHNAEKQIEKLTAGK